MWCRAYKICPRSNRVEWRTPSKSWFPPCSLRKALQIQQQPIEKWPIFVLGELKPQAQRLCLWTSQHSHQTRHQGLWLWFSFQEYSLTCFLWGVLGFYPSACSILPSHMLSLSLKSSFDDLLRNFLYNKTVNLLHSRIDQNSRVLVYAFVSCLQETKAQISWGRKSRWLILRSLRICKSCEWQVSPWMSQQRMKKRQWRMLEWCLLQHVQGPL